MSRKILSERPDVTCCSNCRDGPVVVMVAGIGSTFCETGGLSEFGGEGATVDDEENPVGATSSELGVVEGNAVGENVCNKLKSCNDCETVTSINGQCGVSQ